MLFFKRILKEPEAGSAIVRKERRSDQRLAINPEFPLKAALDFGGRGNTRPPMSEAQGGWNWKGRLINCSALGGRIQLGAAALAARGDICELSLSLENFKLMVPCRITNVRVERDGIHFGLQHVINDEGTRNAYRQFLEIVALGATLKPQFKKTKPDDSGYLVEQYVGGRQSRLTLWRNQSDGKVSAFEFLLKDCLVRAARGRLVEYLSGSDADAARPATPAKALEIQRLFNWVVPNLAATVPDDVRNFLRHYTA